MQDFIQAKITVSSEKTRSIILEQEFMCINSIHTSNLDASFLKQQKLQKLIHTYY